MTTAELTSPEKAGFRPDAFRLKTVSDYILFTFSRTKNTIITSILMCVFSVPLFCLIFKLAVEVDNKTDGDRAMQIYYAFLIISAVLTSVCIIGLLILTFFNALERFRYLHSKQVVDMNYALPMTKTERYAGDFISGIAFPLLPYIVSCILGFILLSTIKTTDAEQFRYIISYIGGVLAQSCLALLFYYTFIVAAISVTGKSRDAVAIPIIAAFALPAIAFTSYALIFGNCYGFVPSVTDAIAAAAPVSPLAYFLNMITEISLSSGVMWFDTGLLNPPHPILPHVLTILVTATLFILGLFANKNRNAERCGNSFTVKRGFLVFASVGIYAITSAFFAIAKYGELFRETAYITPFLTGLFFATLIPFAVAYVSYMGGFRKIKRGIAMYLCITAASGIIANVIPLTQGFGAYNWLPSANDIEYIQTDIGRSEALAYTYERSGRGYINYSLMSFRTPENIQKILDVNKKIIADGGNNRVTAQSSTDGSYAENGEVIYHLKNGTVLPVRNYLVDSRYGTEISQIYRSEEAKTALWDKITANKPTYVNENFLNVTLASKITELGYNGSRGYYHNGDYHYFEYSADSPPQPKYEKVFTNEETKQLVAAYRADFMARTYDSDISDGGRPVVQFTVTRNENFKSVPVNGTESTEAYYNSDEFTFTVMKNDSNFLAALEKTGVPVPALTEVLPDKVYMLKYTFVTDKAADSGYGYSGEMVESDLSDPDTQKLLNVMQEWSPVNGEGYVIIINQTRFIIPVKYQDSAKALYEKLPSA